MGQEEFALAVAILALLFSFFTFFWRDVTRVKLKLWIPPNDLNFVAMEGEDQPYALIINRSPFDVRVRRMFYRVKEFRKRPQDFPVPLAFGDRDALPHVVEARRSHTIRLHRSDFSELWKFRGQFMIELDTMQRRKLGYFASLKLRRYLNDEIRPQDAAASRTFDELSHWAQNSKSDESPED